MFLIGLLRGFVFSEISVFEVPLVNPYVGNRSVPVVVFLVLRSFSEFALLCF